MSAPAEATSVQSQATKPSSRRALLGAGLGALAATVASALGRPREVQATHGDVHLGASNTATTATHIQNTTNNSIVFSAQSDSSGTGVHSSSNTGTGVFGGSSGGFGVRGISSFGTGVVGGSTSGFGVSGSSTSGPGVFGSSTSGPGVFGISFAPDQPAIIGWSNGESTGLLGFSGAASPPPAKAKTAIYGHATQDSNSRGVWGRANAGRGVYGQATSGAGLYGQASPGYAIRGSGRLRLDKISGVATIAAGKTSVVVSPGVDVTSSSFVLLTPRHNIGSRALWYVPNANNDSFNIRISSAIASNTRVAWLLVG